ANAFVTEFFHCPLRVCGQRIHNADAGKYSGVSAHAVEHVGVVETIEAHLNEHGSGYARWVRMGQEILWSEAWGWGIALTGIARIPFPIVSPKVNVGVDCFNHDAFLVLNFPPCSSGEYLFRHLAGHIRETERPATIRVGEPLVIQAQNMQDRRVEIVYVTPVF